MSTELVINHLVPVMGENLCPLQSPVVCSSVLDRLQLRAALRALPKSLAPGWEWKLNHPASTATRQQFLFALLEERRFFAHLVLRCVRAARNSSSPWGAPRSAPAGSNSQPANTQSRSNLLAQRSRPNPPAQEAEPVPLQALWVDMACRWVQAQRSPEEIS